MSKELNEERFGKWWAIEYWLVRVRDEYEEIMAQEELLKELFREPDNGDKYKYYMEHANQLRRILKGEMS